MTSRARTQSQARRRGHSARAYTNIRLALPGPGRSPEDKLGGIPNPGIMAEQDRQGRRDIPICGVNGMLSSKPQKQVIKFAGLQSCSLWRRLSGGKGMQITQPNVWNSRARISNQ